MSGRQTVIVTVLDQEEHSAARVGPTLDFDDGLGSFISRLEEIEDLIPEAYRDTAKISIDSVGGYEDSHEATITITYERPETDVEVLERLAADARKVRWMQAEEIATLRWLQAKYGAAPCGNPDSPGADPAPAPKIDSCDSNPSES